MSVDIARSSVGAHPTRRGVRATTRSDRVCDLARGHSRGRSHHDVSVSAELGDFRNPIEQSANAHEICVVFIGRRTRLCGSRSRAQGASALLRPRLRAAGGLDRAIHEPEMRNYRRPLVNVFS